MATTMVVKRRLLAMAMAMAVALAGTGVVSAKAEATKVCGHNWPNMEDCRLN